MAHPGHPVTPSLFHAGERAIQARAGVADEMESLGRRLIRDHMTDQQRELFGRLPFVLVGAVDAQGAPWASLLEGPPGFMSTPDPRTMRIAMAPAEGDPARDALSVGGRIGLLGIEMHTRRRNRVNGRIARLDDEGLSVAVEQAFGNCPKYIKSRVWSSERTPGRATSGVAERREGLDDDARSFVERADTFFIASHVDGAGVDVSHRGGEPGFVHVSGDVLTIPDYAGNMMFSTLGNLLTNPRAGLLFVDFERGDVFHMTGRAEVIFEGDEGAALPGAERLWRVEVEAMVRRPGALAGRGRGGELWRPVARGARS